MASSLLYLMKGSVMILNLPWPSPLTSTPELCWDILGVWETLQHSKTTHSSLEPKGC